MSHFNLKGYPRLPWDDKIVTYNLIEIQFQFKIYSNDLKYNKLS